MVALALQPDPLDPTYQSVTNPLGLRALQLPMAITDAVASGITVVAVVVGALSLVLRFRHARGVERQQLRWVALAAVPVSLTILAVLAGMAFGDASLIVWAAGISFAGLALAVGAAVARYRLYDLDRVTRSTWIPSPPTCWPSSTGPCSRPGCRCGCDRPSARQL